MKASDFLDEQALIQKFFAPLAAASAAGLKDDGAVLPAAEKGFQWVISTDQIIEGVHFKGNESAGDMARKLVGVNLSDMAAMAARPVYMLLQLAIPGDLSLQWVEEFSEALAELCREHQLSLLGGDMSSLPQGKILASTVIGLVEENRTPRRGNADEGDILAVTGTIGDAALGLVISENQELAELLKEEERDFLLRRYRIPEPRLEEGQRAGIFAHAAIDISDGLMDDLEKLARASGLAATVSSEKIPLSAPARKILEAHPHHLETVLTGGDDYELLFAFDQESYNQLEAELKKRLTVIGRLMRGEGVSVTNLPGHPLKMPRQGFSHFKYRMS